MPVECLSDEQAAGYGRFTGVLSRTDIERFFYLTEADLDLIAQRRSDVHRIGFGVQLGTVRALGRFLEDPMDVPWPAVEFVAEQLGIADPSCAKQYLDRPKTAYEHSWEIRTQRGYHLFEEPDVDARFQRFLDARAWTQAEGPVALFEHAVDWLRRNRVLLPGVTVLARRVSTVRETADARLYRAVADATRRLDPALPGRAAELLAVSAGSRVSELERLRRAPRRRTGPEMVKALQRVKDITGVRAGEVELDDIPANRLTVLGRVGLGAKSSALARMSEPKRTAILVAVLRHLEAAAVDDALDLFALLMATKLFSPARRVSQEQRLETLPRLEHASRTVALAARAVFEAMDAAGDTLMDAATLWTVAEQVASRAEIVAAVEVIEELVPDDGSSADAALHVALTARYLTVRPFVTPLGELPALRAAPGGAGVLAALRSLPELLRRRAPRKPLTAADIDTSLVTPTWKRIVFDHEATVNRDAYVVCVLEHLHRALGRRDVHARPSQRWSDPRARLLAGEAWERVREEVLAGLSLTEPAELHLARQAIALDAAWKQAAGRLHEAGDNARVRVETGADGRARLLVDPLGTVAEPDTLARLRTTVQAMLPRIDLPDLLLEVHGWAGFLDAYTHLSEESPRAKDLPITLAALLVAEACNVGLVPVTHAGTPALTRARLVHVDHNYLRADNHAAANARLVTAQTQIGIAQAWGGGLLASVDGLRFVVPVRTINAGPSPKYFGYKRGITWLNAVNDQVAGIGQMVVPGTPRDSLHILDTLLNLDAGPKPETVTTDEASYSDMVFGMFAILGYRFSPRFADLPDQRYWRADLPDVLPDTVALSTEQAAITDYGPLEAIARNKINLGKIITQWPDMLRVAGSLVTNQVRAYDLLRMFGRDGHPTPLGQAFTEYGRIAKTLHLLAIADPVDDSYRRRMNRQLTVQESRHTLARKICHGHRGQIRQAYREGQEDQLGALGLVLNAVVLWNTRYSDAIIEDLRAKDQPVQDTDVARLSPLGHAHVNFLGRYAFTNQPLTGLRPLRDPTAPNDTDSGD